MKQFVHLVRIVDKAMVLPDDFKLLHSSGKKIYKSTINFCPSALCNWACSFHRNCQVVNSDNKLEGTWFTMAALFVYVIHAVEQFDNT